MGATPFLIAVPNEALEELKFRLQLTRWPDDGGVSSWDYGVPLSVLRLIVAHWRDDFDWRAAERRLNKLPQFRIQLGDRLVHYVHMRGVSNSSAPILITHGWPGSFVEMYKIIPMLTDPENNGFPGFRSFDVVVPSLPGFGFSAAPERPGTNSRVVASVWHQLMAELGYASYFVQGGDIGSGVSSWLARSHPDAVRATHLNFISGGYQPFIGAADRPLSAAESAWLEDRREWAEREGGYNHLQATKPQTLAYSLVDSPTGLAAWILEKFHAWSDGDGDVTERFDIDELLTNISVYWFSGNAAATLRMYRENAGEPLRLGEGERIRPPLCYASFPKEIVNPPREWVERGFDVIRWTEMAEGGHFAALEQPAALARDIHESFTELR